MELTIILITAFAVAVLTLFSGFGLGTLLMPAFALFFSLPVAVAATAVVHLANNLFKSGLLMRHADRQIVLRFGIPALLAALPGAWLLIQLGSEVQVLADWQWGTIGGEITPLKLTIGLLILGLAIFEMLPVSNRLTVSTRWLPLGGAISGFLGGLSGHQGALRAVFLRRLNLDPTAFAATQAVIALLVDLARLAIYGNALQLAWRGADAIPAHWLALACVAAFAGSTLGRLYLPKVKMAAVQWVVAGLLATAGTGLILGLI